jgi:hypothetical protein
MAMQGSREVNSSFPRRREHGRRNLLLREEVHNPPAGYSILILEAFVDS